MALTAVISFAKPIGQHCSVCATLEEKCGLGKGVVAKTMWQTLFDDCVKPVRDCMNNCQDGEADQVQLERLALKANKMQRAHTNFVLRIMKIQMS